jgi:ADP-ribose pyrophosphatase
VLLTPNHIYTTLSRHYLWQSRWYSVRQDQLRQTADGREFTYTIIEKPGAVWVVPVTAAGDLILINQYRYPVGEWCLEVPAGNIEPGTAPAEMAARELREEIGGTAGQIVAVTEFYTMNGIGDEIANVFLALDVVLGEPAREATEHIELIQVPVHEALHMARSGAIKDGPSALAILLCTAALHKFLSE